MIWIVDRLLNGFAGMPVLRYGPNGYPAVPSAADVPSFFVTFDSWSTNRVSVGVPPPTG
jgi:hypothetical protein